MLSQLSMYLLKLLGWNVQAIYPDTGKYIIIAAPHTSNWDFPLGILAARAVKLDVHWIGKHTIFRWPFGWFFRWLGGIPVDRTKSLDVIKQIADLFEQSERLVFALAPEGTRSKTNHWKTGFYYIAKESGVPISLAYLDFGKKQVGIGDSFYPGDDIEEDFKLIREFYKDRRGKNPENESLIRVRSKE